uniref:MaoC-like domain-containing protein n=1 Tax=Triticum urartu TaxID=4572 RepID=A0A8R7UX40_TRIUA
LRHPLTPRTLSLQIRTPPLSPSSPTSPPPPTPIPPLPLSPSQTLPPAASPPPLLSPTSGGAPHLSISLQRPLSLPWDSSSPLGFAVALPHARHVSPATRTQRRRRDLMGVLLRRCSGDPNDAFARGTGGFQRGRVVHGMLVASLFPALITSHAPGAMYASQSLKFAAPVHVRDEVVAQVQALHIKATGARHISPPSA